MREFVSLQEQALSDELANTREAAGIYRAQMVRAIASLKDTIGLLDELDGDERMGPVWERLDGIKTDLGLAYTEGDEFLGPKALTLIIHFGRGAFEPS